MKYLPFAALFPVPLLLAAGKSLPPIDTAAPARTETATFALG